MEIFTKNFRPQEWHQRHKHQYKAIIAIKVYKIALDQLSTKYHYLISSKK